MESYGVVWQENDRVPVAGKLEIDSVGLRLEGNDRSHLTVYLLPICELIGVRVDVRAAIGWTSGRLSCSSVRTATRSHRRAYAAGNRRETPSASRV